MRRLSISNVTSIAVITISLLFILISWLAGGYFREAALQSQVKSLSRIIEVASNQVLKDLQQHAFNLHTALNNDGSLSVALAQYQQGVTEPLQMLLDDPLVNGFAGVSEIDLQQLRVYNLQLEFLLESRHGLQGLPQQLPGFIMVKAIQREGAERLKALSGLWVSAQGPRYSMLMPIGGLRPEGYLELVFDPAYSLTRVGEITNMPLSVSLASEPAPITNSAIKKSGMLPVEYLLYDQQQKPAYRLIGMEDVRQLNQDMRNNQLVTMAGFIATTLVLLLLVLLALNRGIFTPIKNMLQGIEDYRDGKLDTRIRASGPRELYALGETFNSMMGQINHDIDALERYSNLDGLTGLSNRRYLEQRLKEEWSRSTRNNTPLSLLFIDIDYFKHYNDHYGHLQGDDCLRHVAAAIQQSVKRDIDVAARYGGEEFVILLPETDLNGAEQVARELQQTVRRLHIQHSGSSVESFVTLSIGIASQIATFPEEPESLLQAADEALYHAKEEGRNRISKTL